MIEVFQILMVVHTQKQCGSGTCHISEFAWFDSEQSPRGRVHG